MAEVVNHDVLFTQDFPDFAFHSYKCMYAKISFLALELTHDVNDDVQILRIAGANPSEKEMRDIISGNIPVYLANLSCACAYVNRRFRRLLSEI